jgi:hypothetical protein
MATQKKKINTGGTPKPPKPKPVALYCSYGGVDYSGGATVEMPAGGGKTVVKRCNPTTGCWEIVTNTH